MKKQNLQEKRYKYKFSIIMTVYNVEMFLAEAIESVIQQDIGFKKNIQLILVNDGSKDHSGKICDEYQEKYPENIVVVHKENGGVSSARNEGLYHIEGEYVNCLDSDDKLSSDTLRIVYKRFKEWENEVDLVTIPLYFFDGEKGEHPLNYKFEQGTRIIDLEKEYDKPVLSMSCSFVRNCVVSKYRFDSRLAYAEDAKLINQILLEKKKYGAVAEGHYWYRKRMTGGASAIQTSLKNSKWYIESMKYFVMELIRDCKQKEDDVLPLFIQYALMYDLQWRFKAHIHPKEVLSPAESETYFYRIKQALSFIDDKIILEQKFITIDHKLYALQFKYGRMPEIIYHENDIDYFYNDYKIGSESENAAGIEFIKFKDNAVEIEGFIQLPLYSKTDRVDIYIESNGKLIECEKIERESNICSFGKTISFRMGFFVRFIPEKNAETKVSLLCRINGALVRKKYFVFGKFSPLSSICSSYAIEGKYIIMCLNSALYVYPYSLKKHIRCELSFLKSLLSEKEKAAYKAFFLRIVYRLYKLFPHKNVWLISDRISKADDNGEVFFEYVCNRNEKNVRPIFAVSKSSTDYSRVAGIGKVIRPVGWLYKWYCLCGAKIISSQGEDYVFHPFGDFTKYYSDLIQNNQYIFLQHGVICNDLSEWLRRYNKNIQLFVTTTISETNSILEYNYGYAKDIVKTLGLPRYDKLYHDEKKYITIIPSWRAYLVGPEDCVTGKRQVLGGFEKSRYYKMYSTLLTDRRLIDYAKAKGYGIRFMSHPNMIECNKLLKIDPDIQVINVGDYEYRKIFAETNLLITDYSSIAFDFAYLRKPVLYYQADFEDFYSGAHTLSRGYFEYDRDGFGEVIYQEAVIIDTLIDYMKNNCELKEMYRQRIDNTFLYNDKNNCTRVYEAVCNLK